MSTNAPRLIIVDNVDPGIKYTGPWFLDQGSENDVGTFGPPYESILHGTNANASLSFAFNGSQITVVGTDNTQNVSGVLDPTWQCFVDGNNIGVGGLPIFPENNWFLCSQDSLTDGPHVITVNATILTNLTFWFEGFQYLPSASVPLDQASIMVGRLDPAIHYGTGWQALGTSANMTLVSGSTLTFNFIGVSLSWYGYIPAEFPHGPSAGTYSIDGETPTNFLLKGLSADGITVFDQKFFEIDQLSPTSHTLTVVYQGSNSTPLTLSYLIIQNGTSTSTVTSALTSSLTTSTTTGISVSGTSTPGKSSTRVGPVVGGVFGGIALVLFAILGFYLLHRRQKRTAKETASTSMPNPFEYIPPHSLSITPDPSSPGSISYSQTGNAVTYGVKGHRPTLPNFTTTNVSQPPITSSTYPTNSLTLRPQSPGRGDPSMLVSVQNNDSRLPDPNIVLHEDSGIRMPPRASAISDVPPLYTPD